MRETLTLSAASDSQQSSAATRDQNSAISSGIHAAVGQGISSLGNFFATVIIGREAGKAQLGVYSLTLTVLFIAAAMQRALVVAPYMVQSQGLSKTERKLRRGSTLFQVLVVGLTLCLSLGALVDLLVNRDASITISAAMLAGAVASWGLRDCYRCILFADHEFKIAAIYDGVCVTLQVVALVALAITTKLTATTGLLSVILSSGLVTLAWILFRHTDFTIRPSAVIADTKASWHYGRWSTVSETIFAAQPFAIQSILAAQAGLATTGVYAACMSIVRLINPLFQATGNYIGPRSALSLHEGGVQKLANGVRVISKYVTLAASAYAIGIYFCGGWAFDLLYGEKYGDQHTLLFILALATAINALGMAPSKGIAALEKPQLNLLANALSFVTVVGLTWLSFHSYGVMGMAYSFLIGYTVCAACRWGLFRFLVTQRIIESGATQ